MSLAEGRLISVVSNEQCSVGTSSNNGSSSVLADWSQAVSLIAGKKEKKKRKLIYIWMLNRVDRFVDDVEGINLDSRNIKHHPLTIHKLFSFLQFHISTLIFPTSLSSKGQGYRFSRNGNLLTCFPNRERFPLISQRKAKENYKIYYEKLLFANRRRRSYASRQSRKQIASEKMLCKN